MRTTVTLDPDVAARVKDLAHRSRQSFKATLNDLLRRGLAVARLPRSAKPFVVEPHDGEFLPGIDPARLNQVVDELEVGDYVREARRSR